MTSKRTLGVLLFPEFELLDVFGPLEMFGMAPEDFDISLVAERAQPMASRQGPESVVDYSFANAPAYDILLIPGGSGTRTEVDNDVLLDWLRNQCERAEYVTSVCTGSALLAKAGLLDGLHATSNKKAFEWVVAQGPNVIWEKQARWVEDGKYFTSSGISAGMDMSLAFMAKLLGDVVAEQAATWSEYEWHRDAAWDPFAKIYDLI